MSFDVAAEASDQFMGRYSLLLSPQHCPVLPGVERVGHWSLADPSAAEGTDEERLAAFRDARDHIRNGLRLFILAGGREDLAPPAPATLARRGN